MCRVLPVLGRRPRVLCRRRGTMDSAPKRYPEVLLDQRFCGLLCILCLLKPPHGLSGSLVLVALDVFVHAKEEFILSNVAGYMRAQYEGLLPSQGHCYQPSTGYMLIHEE
ncbi:hypothetical protein ATANTOWER_008258 [Ataeniobius toweri]|uniref:Uncharacterized protein n=1 Tax=Ataeniobius toweri TaxID=208326 RepID=A0ABU7CFF1_9TELE|nr:hypothetical protein [Ataeniobius toweri]